jgi:flavin reductase
MRHNQEPTVDRTAFLDAMSHAVTGVSVVTTDGPGGRFGLTASSMTSLSADPPMLLVCINRRSPLSQAIDANRSFSVNVLTTRQRHVADTFAGHPDRGEPYAFSPGNWDLDRSTAPRLRGAVALFECELVAAHDFGSHALFVARVTAADGEGGPPLLYSQRTYGRPCPWSQPD